MDKTNELRTGSSSINDVFSSSPLILGFGLTAVGIALREYSAGAWPYIGVALVAILFLGIEYLRRRLTMQVLLIACACAFIVLLGMLLHSMKMSQVALLSDQCAAGTQWQPVHLQGYVISTPRFRPDKSLSNQRRARQEDVEPWLTAVEVQYHTLISGGSDGVHRTESFGIVLIVIPGRHRDLLPGDQVDCYLKWRRIPPPSNPGEMDIAQRLRQKGIFAQGKAKSLEQVKKFGWPRYWNPNRYLGQFAMAGDRAIERCVPFDQAPLASALVLGQREQIEWKLSETLLETGTIHMLAISGMHVEMVAISVGILCMLLRMPQRTVLIVVCLVVVGYTFLCGANAPVLRAMFAVLLVSFARFFGLRVYPYNLLSLAALIVIALRTDHLWDTGTQLSFLAVAVLIYIANEHSKSAKLAIDPLDELIAATDTWQQAIWRRLKQFCKQSLGVSAWVWLVTTPIVLSTFHVMSPIAILMNLILLVPLWLGLLSGLAVLVFGPVLPWIGTVFGFVCGTSLVFTEQAIALAARMPLSHWWLPSPPFWWLVGFYILLLVLVIAKFVGRLTNRGILQSLIFFLMLGCAPWNWLVSQDVLDKWYYFEPSDRKDLVLTFIDVGHGTSVVVQVPNGEVWLYDAGRMGDPDRAFYPIASTLWHMRVRKIDRLFISHADSDHFNAIPAIVKRFDVRRVYTTPQVTTSLDPNMQRLLAILDREGVPVETIASGVQLFAGPLTATILHPLPNTEYGGDNADSLSLLIEHANRKILLPGDLEGRGTMRLLREPPTFVDVLMAPHHGSLSESPEPLLGWVTPKACGYQRRF